ncbi:MAG: hypothetical protein AB1716_17895, partial [Planctomycetota bacterium]
MSVTAAGDRGLSVVVATPGVEVGSAAIGGRAFTWVRCPESLVGGTAGQPALPVVRRLFCTPPGLSVRVQADAGTPVLFDLAAASRADAVAPLQDPPSWASAEELAARA